MRKIIHVLTDTNIGGAGIWLLNFLKAFRSENYEVVVALPENAALTPMVEEIGIRVCEIRGVADQSFSKEGVGVFRELFEEEKPDIVHTHASLSARIAARHYGAKVVNTRHCLEEPKHGIKKVLYALVNNLLSNVVIGVSEITCKNLADDGTLKRKIRLVYNGVYPVKLLTDDERAEARRKYEIDADTCVVGIVARLEEAKNHRLFIDAAKLVLEEEQNVLFMIVGSGTKENELKAYVKELGIADKIIFTGYISDVTEIMNILDINALTSPKEALSISLIEGMSVSVPGVSTASGGPEEVIEDGKSGIIVHSDKSADFAQALLRLIRDPELRKKMGHEGERKAKTVFSPGFMVATLERIYDEL